MRWRVVVPHLYYYDNPKAEEDLKSLGDLRDCLFNPNSGLQNIDLMYNRIGEAGAVALAPALGADNTKIKTFLVDLTLPMHAFDMIFRRDAGGKKKGKCLLIFVLFTTSHALISVPCALPLNVSVVREEREKEVETPKALCMWH